MRYVLYTINLDFIIVQVIKHKTRNNEEDIM